MIGGLIAKPESQPQGVVQGKLEKSSNQNEVPRLLKAAPVSNTQAAVQRVKGGIKYTENTSTLHACNRFNLYTQPTGTFTVGNQVMTGFQLEEWELGQFFGAAG